MLWEWDAQDELCHYWLPCPRPGLSLRNGEHELVFLSLPNQALARFPLLRPGAQSSELWWNFSLIFIIFRAADETWSQSGLALNCEPTTALTVTMRDLSLECCHEHTSQYILDFSCYCSIHWWMCVSVNMCNLQTLEARELTKPAGSHAALPQFVQNTWE